MVGVGGMRRERGWAVEANLRPGNEIQTSIHVSVCVSAILCVILCDSGL